MNFPNDMEFCALGVGAIIEGVKWYSICFDTK